MRSPRPAPEHRAGACGHIEVPPATGVAAAQPFPVLLDLDALG